MKTSQGSVDLSVRPQLSLSLEIDSNGASSSKRDTEGLEARKVLTNSAYRINYYSPLILHWDEKGVDLMAHALQYAIMRYTGSAFRDWASEETTGDSMGKAPGSFQLHKQSENESGKAPEYRDNSGRALFAQDSMTCPAGKDCDSEFDCSADLCESGDEVCDEESTKVRGGSTIVNKNKLGGEVPGVQSSNSTPRNLSTR